MASSTITKEDGVFILQGPSMSEGHLDLGGTQKPPKLIEYPFYTNQPTEKMNRLFAKYKEIFSNTLGESVVSINQIGSGAIPGMPGSPMIDIIVSMKNYPPTEDQMQALQQLNLGLMFGTGKAPHAPDDTWLRSFDFPPQGDFEEFKIDGGFPPEGYLGRIVVHLVHYSNPFVVRALAYVEYLKSNDDAFKRYRDVKMQEAKMGDGKHGKGDNTFVQYKINKTVVVKELMDEALAWKAESGLKFPEEQM